MKIYLDHNATTPVADEVARAMLPFMADIFGNPSSMHWAGVPARDAVEKARQQVASLLCCDPTEIIFTSGGTEANNLAIKGLYFGKAARSSPFHIITTAIEHPSVLGSCGFLELLGAEVTRVPVDRHGLVDPADIRNAICPRTTLVSVMHANNEVGTIQPIWEIAEIAHEHGIVLHSDAAQSVGKIPVDVEALGVDLLSIAGHKLYGPKGVGALFVRDGIALEPLMHGADHEAHCRAGTENVLEIVGLGAACNLAQTSIDDASRAALRDDLWRELKAAFGDRVVLNGHPTHRLPNTLNVGFRGCSGRDVLAIVPEIAASTGSACHAGSMQISPVLAAMGVEPDAAYGAVRFSLGRTTTPAEIETLIALLVARFSAIETSIARVIL